MEHQLSKPSIALCCLHIFLEFHIIFQHNFCRIFEVRFKPWLFFTLSDWKPTHTHNYSMSACLSHLILWFTQLLRDMQQQQPRFSAPNWRGRGWSSSRSRREDGVSFVIFIAARHALLHRRGVGAWGEGSVMQPFVRGRVWPFMFMFGQHAFMISVWLLPPMPPTSRRH